MAQQNDDNIDPSLYKALRKAIRDDGDPAQVKRIFREHPEMIRVETGLGLWLHYAALSGRLNVVEMLLSECGFSANDTDERGERPLNAAIRNGHLHVARYLLDHGAEFDLSTAAQNPLFTAIYNRQLDIAKLLIELGIDVNVRHTGERFKNWSAADFAKDIGALEFLPLLEATGADTTAAPQEPAQNETVFPRHLYQLVRKAIDSGNPEQLKEVFRVHPDAVGLTSVFGSWLHEAAMGGKLKIVQMLLDDFGFNINMPGGDTECTPLRYAVSKGHLDVVQDLLRRGALLDTETIYRNPLFAAIYGRNVEISQLLIDHGIDVNARYTNENYINRSAADYARRLDALEFLPLLEAAGADLTPEQYPEPTAILPADPATAEQTVLDFFDVHYGMDEVHPQLVTQMLHLSPPLKVYVLPPRRENAVVYCFTAGLSSRAMNTPPEGAEFAFAELFIVLPPECYDERQGLSEPYHWIAEWMVRITTQMRECDTCLGGPLTIIANDHPPQPLGPQVKFTCWLLLADQTEARSDGRTVWFYRMVPLYTKERDFEVQHGMTALLDRFDEKKLSFVTDFKRSCLC